MSAAGMTVSAPRKKTHEDKVQGFRFVTVLFVDIEQDEQGGGDGKEEEIQHYLFIGG